VVGVRIQLPERRIRQRWEATGAPIQVRECLEAAKAAFRALNILAIMR